MSRFTIYNASAGSGKTYTLAVQYIARLLASRRESEAAYRQILAVTFTNKATAEMKDRILQQLYGISACLEESDGYMKSVSEALSKMGADMGEADIRRESGRLLHAILHDYSRFRVETIDTFFRSVLTDMAHELGLPAGLKADIDSKRAISEAVDRIIGRLTYDDRLRGWVTDFVTEKMEDGKRWDVASDIKSFARHIFDADYLAYEQPLDEFLSDDTTVANLRAKLDETYREMVAMIEDFAAPLYELSQHPLAAKLKNARYFNGYLNKLQAAIAGGAIEEPGVSAKKMADDYEYLVRNKKDPEEVHLAQQIQEAMSEIVPVHSKAVSVLNTISLTRRHINPMRLLATVACEVNAVAAEHGAFLLSNTNILLDRMMGADDASFIYEKTGSVLHHIMLDEFQDTSSLQWSNFQTLIHENMSKGGSTLVVGDVKQSIYRWRGGDCNILATLHDEMKRRDYAPDLQPLKTNYRSTEHIINFNNKLYKSIADKVDEQNDPKESWTIKDIYTEGDIKQEYGPKTEKKGYVQVVFQNPSKETDMRQNAADEMCDTIAQLIAAGHKPEDIAILIRNNNDMDIIAQTFANRIPDVPLVSDDVFLLRSSVAVSILVNALRVIAHPTDRASMGRLVYLYHKEVLMEEVSLNELFDRANGSNKSACKGELSYFQSMCRHLPPAFSGIDQLRRQPLYELLMRLTDMFRVNDIPGQAAYLMTFYDSILGNRDDCALSLIGFLRYWDDTLAEKSIPGGDIKGVNIMTIHRAKGLQWQTVFIPFCDWTIHDSKSSIMWCKTEDTPLFSVATGQGEQRCLPVAAIQSIKRARQSIFAKSYIREQRNQRIDNLNLLYVATTRAEHNLYIWGACPQGASTNPSMIKLIASVVDKLPVPASITDSDVDSRYAYGKVSAVKKAEDKDTSANRLDIDYDTPTFSPTLYPPLMDFKQSNDAERFTGNTDEERLTPTQSRYINSGTVLHAIFSAITTRDDLHKAVRALPMSMTKTEDGQDLRQRAISLIERGCQTDSRVESWFSGQKSLYNECTIAALDPKTGRAVEHRPDRVMMNGNEIIVVDFKFGKQDEEHVTQVQDYIRLLADMHPGKQVSGYLWYVYQNEVVRVESSELGNQVTG